MEIITGHIGLWKTILEKLKRVKFVSWKLKIFKGYKISVLKKY